MQYGQFGEHYVLRLKEGEEAVSTIRRFLAEHNILAGYFVGWGAFRRLRLQHNRLVEGRYQPVGVDLDRQVEVASLLGDIAVIDDQLAIHAHLVAGDEDFHTLSGHLAEGTVGPTLEVVVSPLPRALHRFWNAGLNVAVLDPEEAAEEAERLEAWP